MRSGRKSTNLMTQDQMVKQEEEGSQQEVGKQSYHLTTNPLMLIVYIALPYGPDTRRLHLNLHPFFTWITQCLCYIEVMRLSHKTALLELSNGANYLFVHWSVARKNNFELTSSELQSAYSLFSPSTTLVWVTHKCVIPRHKEWNENFAMMVITYLYIEVIEL